MSLDFPGLLDMFEKAPAGIQKFWKLYLHLLITPESEKKTRKHLKNFLKVSEANISQILTVFESRYIIQFSRDLNLPGKTKEFVEIDVVSVLNHLALEGGLDGDDLEEYVDFFYSLLAENELLLSIDEELISIFDKSGTSGKFLSFLVKNYPPLFFVLPFILSLSSNQHLLTEDLIKKAPRVVVDWVLGFYQQLVTVLAEKVMPDISIPRFGSFRQLELDTADQESGTDTDDSLEETISIFEIIETTLAGLSDGYFVKNDRIQVSALLPAGIQEIITPSAIISINIATEDGKTFNIPVKCSWMMDYNIFKE